MDKQIIPKGYEVNFPWREYESDELADEYSRLVEKVTDIKRTSNIPINATIVTSGGGGSTTYRQVTGTDLGATFQLSGTIQYISAS